MTDPQLVDLAEVVDVIARIVGGPVVIEDADFRVLAYSAIPSQPNDEARREAILRRRTPDPWLRWFHESGIKQRLITTEEVVELDLPWPGLKPRLITGIHGGGRVVGFLWVMEGEVALPDDVTDTMRHFAEAIAPELTRRSSGLVDNPQSYLLRQFFAHAVPAAQIAEALQVPESTAVVVIAVAILAEGADGISLRSRAVKLLDLQSSAGHHRPRLVGAVDQQIYLLEAVSDEVTSGGLEAELSATVGQLANALDTKVLAAAGSVHGTVAEGGKSREEADVALNVLRSGCHSGAVGCYDRLRYKAVLLEVAQFLRERPLLSGGVLERLSDHDNAHGTEYLRSLVAYLDAFGNVRQAAGLLHIHPNSLRYRIRRLSEIVGLDLADPDQRLAVQLLLTARFGRHRAAASSRP